MFLLPSVMKPRRTSSPRESGLQNHADSHASLTMDFSRQTATSRISFIESWRKDVLKSQPVLASSLQPSGKKRKALTSLDSIMPSTLRTPRKKAKGQKSFDVDGLEDPLDENSQRPPRARTPTTVDHDELVRVTQPLGFSDHPFLPLADPRSPPSSTTSSVSGRRARSPTKSPAKSMTDLQLAQRMILYEPLAHGTCIPETIRELYRKLMPIDLLQYLLDYSCSIGPSSIFPRQIQCHEASSMRL